jgi:predicted cupin superfamily sugar epimerase
MTPWRTLGWEKKLHPRVSELIATHQLHEHPEGGWYRETHRSPLKIETQFGIRSAATSILFLLDSTNFSAFHRLAQEEVWHFHDGDPLELHLIHSDGRLEQTTIGPHQPQHVVPPSTLQAAATKGVYSLCGCTVAPGFDFEDFELPSRATLLSQYPQHADLIRLFTR